MIPTVFRRAIAGLIVVAMFAADARADWTQFRGPMGQGKSEETGLPAEWTEAANVAWKTAVPGSGWSSPVVQGDQVWVTAAKRDGAALHALCFNADDGQLLHDVLVFEVADPDSINPKNTYASPTPVLSEEFAYVHFGTYGTACLKRDDGDIVWTNRELTLEHKEGPGSSPILYEDRLIIPCDGLDVQYVVALDAATGEIIWKTERTGTLHENPDFRKAYSTPLVTTYDGRTEAICVGADQVIAYDPADGREIWKARYKGFSNVPTPVLGDGVVYVCTDYARPNLMAVRLGGEGDVTDTHVLWTATRQISAIPSPLILDGSIYMVSNGGVFSRLDAQTGQTQSQRRLGGNFAASPVFGDGKLYLCSESGETTVVVPPEQIVATNRLDGQILSTPAIAKKSLFIRTGTHLYRISSRQ